MGDEFRVKYGRVLFGVWSPPWVAGARLFLYMFRDVVLRYISIGEPQLNLVTYHMGMRWRKSMGCIETFAKEAQRAGFARWPQFAVKCFTDASGPAWVELSACVE